MNDIQLNGQSSQPVSAPQTTQETTLLPAVAPAKRSRCKLLLTIGGVLGLCACVTLFGVIYIAGKIGVEQPKVENVIEQFMGFMVDKDVEKAYDLFSARAKRVTSLSALEEFLHGNNYVLFAGYSDVTITNFTLNATANLDQTLPQGQVAEVIGIITYEDNFTGNFNAILEKEGGEWRLYNINIIVPPNKFGSNW